ncbi:MAG TPA: FixH family protein [Steroidobacteraceae bacterium]|nr:FixH family protein [Steroidobacteraceae bacterium]
MSARQASDARPWYRQFWPWLLIVPPAATVVGGVLTLSLALRHPEYDVRDGHYRDGLGVYRAAEPTGGAAAIDRDALLLLDREGRVQVSVRGGEQSREVLLHLTDPATREHREIRLREAGEGRFEGQVILPAAAMWQALLTDERAGWSLAGAVSADGRATRLEPAPDGHGVPPR